MSTYVIKKLELYNFKIFSHASVYFDGNDISILDGPNGFGKTTIFDAIEYALTGNIQRITEDMQTDGKLSFFIHFLAHNPGDIVWVQAFLSDGTNDIVIQRKINNGTGKENNPSQLVTNTRTAIITGGECFEYQHVQEANIKLAEYISSNVQKYFKQYYYLSQENSLAFLSKSETDRMKALNYIFHMEKEQLLKDKANSAINKFANIAKELGKRGELLYDELLKLQTTPNSTEHLIPYKKLAVDIASPSWDQENLIISGLETLRDLQKQLHNIALFTRQFNWFLQQKKNIWIEQQIKSSDELKQNLILQSIQLESFFEIANKYNEVKQIINKSKIYTDTPDYEGVNYKRLSELLNIQYSTEEVRVCIEKISDCRKGMQAQEKARSNLISLRKQLENQRQNWLQSNYSGLGDNECPFCGRLWDSQEQLDEHIQIVTEAINSGSSQLVEQFNQSLSTLQRIYQEIFTPTIKDFLKVNQYLEIDILQRILSDKNKAIQRMKDFCSKASGYGILIEKNILALDNIKQWDSIFEVFCSQQLQNYQHELPVGFIESASVCEFNHIFEVTFLGNEETIKHMPIITEDVEKQKAVYLEQQYYLQQEKRAAEIRKKIENIKQQNEKAVRIQKQFENLQRKLTLTIQDYEKKIVQQLQIPFFLFCGRILQNYPGGLGVCLKTKGAKSIHFDASNRQGHDIIYTMSSGQLSGVSIALLLTLNRIYAENSFRCVLIDDPIQTMDELNVTSFVDLLRNDFPEYQFIISTHEEEFSNYIRYKFYNYNYSQQSIDVRTLNNEDI
jgi:DNA repair protein SbcC/Rad50